LSYLHSPATPVISTLSLHDALPISQRSRIPRWKRGARSESASRSTRLRWRAESTTTPPYGHLPPLPARRRGARRRPRCRGAGHRSEEHTSELQSRDNLVCRLLLEKK